MKLTILHITDLHAKSRITFEDKKIESIASIVNNDSHSNDVLLLFSGDLSFSGSKEQFKIVDNFILGIKNALVELNSSKTLHVAICPGNHDRCFKNEEEMLPEYVSEVSVDNFTKCLNDNLYLMEPFNNYAGTFEKYEQVNEILGCYKFRIAGETVKIFSLNNSLLSVFVRNKKDSTNYNCDNILLPNDLMDIKRKNEELSFLLMHMPFSYLNQKTKNYLTTVCNQNIDVVFDGHVHEESITIKNDNFIEITSSALYEDEASGFTIIHVGGNTLQPIVYVFDDGNQKKYRPSKSQIPSVIFQEKTNTIDGFSVNKSFIDDNKMITLSDGIQISVDDIFVFPYLREKKYRFSGKNRKIESFDKLIDFTKDKRLINIIGDESTGKSTLARQLFYSFIKEGKSPILCDGRVLESKNTKRNAKDRIIYQIKDSYLDNNIADDYFELDISKRILIIDDFGFVSTSLLEDLSSLFGKIIFFSEDDSSQTFTLSSFPGLPSCKLSIEPLYRSKREEMCKKIYEKLHSFRKNLAENITYEKFILVVEKMIDKMDISYMIDPALLLDLSAKALLNIEVFTSGRNIGYQKDHYNYLLEQEIRYSKNDKCTPVMVERILSEVAYFAYENKINDIDEKDFEKALNNEIDIYETTPFKNVEQLLSLLTNAKFIKNSDEKPGAYRFFSIKIFAFYVGKYAMICHNDGNDDPFNIILSRGFYSQLNFDILMSVAYTYDVEKIPNFFVDDLFNEICSRFTPTVDNLNGIKVYFLSEKKRLSRIDDKEKKKIRDKISRDESASREEYVNNIDNFFYEKTTSKNMKELTELINKTQIVASLLNSADLLKGKQKRKLVEIAIVLPNIVLDKYINYVQKALEYYYIKILDEIENEKDTNRANGIISELDEFFDFLVSAVSATILTIYDIGSRPLNNPIMNEKLRVALKEIDDSKRIKMPEIQRLMLLSFSNSEDLFAESIRKYLKDEKDSFNKNCALLIARRYCIDNYDYLNSKKSKFLKEIQALFGNGLLIEAKKL